ncbi:MAG: hypothetical protein ACLSV2_11760 [Clostridium sp.]
MKKTIAILMVVITLIFITFISIPVFASNVFEEGVYTVKDFVPSKNPTYYAQNISPDASTYLIVLDENLIAIQVIRLCPKSQKYNLVPLKPEYKVIIAGNGRIYIN